MNVAGDVVVPIYPVGTVLKTVTMSLGAAACDEHDQGNKYGALAHDQLSSSSMSYFSRMLLRMNSAE
jgi:hypothetical protein